MIVATNEKGYYATKLTCDTCKQPIEKAEGVMVVWDPGPTGEPIPVRLQTEVLQYRRMLHPGCLANKRVVIEPALACVFDAVRRGCYVAGKPMKKQF